ncbi:MAG: hypothetical protein ABSG08_01060 [Terriglobales bacterium]|jgi:hypothetical protein
MSKPNRYQPPVNTGGILANAPSTKVTMKVSDFAKLPVHPLARQMREQVSEKFQRWLEENGMTAEPERGFPVGEYLGDLDVTNAMLAGLANINPFINSINRVTRGKYIVWADFDYAGDGHFIGLRMEPLRETVNEVTQ